MKLFFNESGEVDVAGLNGRATVADFFDAIETFTVEHPVPCRGCPKNCCDKQFFIEMDSVSARKLAGDDMAGFIQRRLQIIYPSAMSVRIFLSKVTDRCQYLNERSECTIYEHRPATCRIYMCHPRSTQYTILSRGVAAALQNEMNAIYFELLVEAPDSPPQTVAFLKEALAWLKNSPAHKKTDYRDIPVQACIRFDMEGQQLSDEVLRIYNALLAMEEG